jgi:hypothetical protein
MQYNLRMLLYDWRKDSLPQHTRNKSTPGRLVYYLSWLNVDSYSIAIVSGILLFYLPKSINTAAAIVAGVVLSLLWRLVKSYYGVSVGLFKYRYASTPVFDIITIVCLVLVAKMLFLK